MNFKKAVSYLCVVCLMAAVLTGCGNNAGKTSSVSSTSSSSADTSRDLSNSEIVGQVQSIDGKAVTLLLGELSGDSQNPGSAPGSPASSSGTPAAPASSSAAPAAGTDQMSSAPAKPQAQNSEAPANPGSGSSSSENSAAGNPPALTQQPGGGKTFTAGTETVSITLSDSTEIVEEGVSGETDGTIDDITVGSVLDVTLGADQTVTTVRIENVNSPDGAVASGASETAGTSPSGASEAASSKK